MLQLSGASIMDCCKIRLGQNILASKEIIRRRNGRVLRTKGTNFLPTLTAVSISHSSFIEPNISEFLRANSVILTRKKAKERKSHVVALGPGPELGGAVDAINNLGLDALTFLAATVVVIPAFKALSLSPVKPYPILLFSLKFSPSILLNSHVSLLLT